MTKTQTRKWEYLEDSPPCPLCGNCQEGSVLHEKHSGLMGSGVDSTEITHVVCGDCGVHFTPKGGEPIRGKRLG